MDNSIASPIVSVCIASYNYEAYVGEAIESVVNQTYTNWEIIIVDDASTDNSFFVIRDWQRRYPDKIHFIHSPENKGVCHSFNLAFKTAKGKYIALLGSDDRMQATRLEQQVQYLADHQEVGVVCSLINIIDSQGEPSYSESLFDNPIVDLKTQLLEGNFLNAPSAMIRSEVFEKVGLYNEALPYTQDFDHWLRILPYYEIQRIPEKLTDYRVHGENLSVKGDDQLPYAGTYETYICIYRAIVRENNKLEQENLSAQQLIDEKLKLVEALIKAEQRFLGTFKNTASYVYEVLLGLHEIDSSHPKLKHLLNQVYIALGDKPRSKGEKPITIEQYKLIDNSNVSSLEDTALVTHNNTGISLDVIVNSILENKSELFIEKQRKEQFIFSVVKRAFDQLKSEISHKISSLNQEQQDSYNDIYLLLISNAFNVLTQEVLALKSEMVAWRIDCDYQTWINNHALLEIDAELHAERLMSWSAQPCFNVVVLLFDGQQSLLANTIDSLAQQLYGNWKLTVIGDGSAPDEIFNEVDVLEWVSFPDGADLYAFLNTYMTANIHDWLLFAPAGVEFQPHMFLKLGDYINLFPGKAVFYFDDDLVDDEGNRTQPRFKPDFNLDLLRSSDYLGVIACEPDVFKSLNGFEALPGSENVSLAFKTYENMGRDAIGHIDDVLVHLPKNKMAFPATAFSQAVQNHLIRSCENAHVSEGLLEGTVRVNYLVDDEPKISILLPTRDKIEFLRPCVLSVIEKTQYQNYELLIIDNQSESPETLAFFDWCETHHPDNIKILKYPHPFNYASMMNMAVEEAVGEYIVFLNNDTEVLQAEWLDRMLSHAQRSEVGAVGVRLVYPETGVIQHAGAVVGMGSSADHPYLGLATMQDSGYMGRLQLEQNYSAVTAACLMVSKAQFEAVGGMDDELFAINFNDVDFCLKLGEKGYLNVWTPYVTLIHHGSISRRAWSGEKQTRKLAEAIVERRNLNNKWLPIAARDPAHNRHLSLSTRFPTIEYQIPGNWDNNFHERPQVLGLPLSGGSGDYRVIQPFTALSQAALAQCEYYRFSRGKTRPIHIAEYARISPDVILFQAAINDNQLEQIEQVAEFLPDVTRVYTIDDLLTNIPEQSPVYEEVQRFFRDTKTRLRKALSQCDRLIVSTQPLAELSAELIDDIRVIPNRLPRDTWASLISLRQQSDKPRVGWAGAHQHQGDLALIVDVVKELANEVDWVFMGMYPEEIRPYIKEFHEFVPIDDYPKKLASLNLDLALAPLEQHPFNESKSNLRLLEYGVLGWPVIATDIYPYQTNNPPIVRVENEPEQWINAIRTALSDTVSLHKAGDGLKAWVLEHYILEDHLDEWLSALTDKSKR